METRSQSRRVFRLKRSDVRQVRTLWARRLPRSAGPGRNSDEEMRQLTAAMPGAMSTVATAALGNIDR